MANVVEDESQPVCIAYEALHSPLSENICDQDPMAIAMKSVTDPDTMYLWEARKEPDFPKFLEAMQKEVDDHTREGHWRLIHKKDVPKGATVLPAVWSMKCKRRIATQEVYKWKARINIDGSKQVYGIHYNETYSPVVAWPTTRFFLTQSLLNNWKTKQIDFVLAFPQAPVERDLYMEIPKGIHVEGAKEGEEYVLQLVRNLYGQKQAGRIWYQYLVDGLEDIGFTRSEVDECVLYYKNSVLLVYVDDSILMGPDDNELAYLLQEMQKRFKIQEEGDLCDYLRIEIKKESNGSMTLTQPQLIDSILQDLKLNGANVKS
jgi:hypothetical protein